MKERQLILTIILILVVAFAAFVLNFFVLDSLFIPDICYYHNHEFKTNKIFDLFYSFPPGEGGHPSPTNFYFIFTLTAGALLAGYYRI